MDPQERLRSPGAEPGGRGNDAEIRIGISSCLLGEEVRFDGMILLSDGMATAGETNDVVIHQNAIRNNPDKARVFTFSVGRDADLALMEALARSNRGRHFQLNDAQADRELVDRVRELFEDIRMPTLTGLELDVAAVGAADVLPERMGDVFAAVETWHRQTDLAVLPDDLDLSALGLAGFARATVEDLTARRDDPAARDALALLYRLAGGGAP